MKLFNPKKLEEKFNINHNPIINYLKTFLSEKKFLSQNQFLKLYFTYDENYFKFPKKAHIQLNSQLLLITKEPQRLVNEMSNFSFLKQKIK
jgi:hypothetical protein